MNRMRKNMKLECLRHLAALFGIQKGDLHAPVQRQKKREERLDHREGLHTELLFAMHLPSSHLANGQGRGWREGWRWGKVRDGGLGVDAMSPLVFKQVDIQSNKEALCEIKGIENRKDALPLGTTPCVCFLSYSILLPASPHSRLVLSHLVLSCLVFSSLLTRCSVPFSFGPIYMHFWNITDLLYHVFTFIYRSKLLEDLALTDQFYPLFGQWCCYERQGRKNQSEVIWWTTTFCWSIHGSMRSILVKKADWGSSVELDVLLHCHNQSSH